MNETIACPVYAVFAVPTGTLKEKNREQFKYSDFTMYCSTNFSIGDKLFTYFRYLRYPAKEIR